MIKNNKTGPVISVVKTLDVAYRKLSTFFVRAYHPFPQ